LSPQHPLSIHIHGEDITGQEYVPWHIQENQVSFTLANKQVDSGTLNPSSIASSPFLIGLILLMIGALILAGVFFARRQSDKSNYEIVLDEDEDEEEDEDDAYADEDDDYYDDEDEFSANDEEQDDENDVEDDAPVRRRVPPRRTASSKRVPIQPKETNEAKQLLQESSKEVVRKRRALQSEHDTVRTKRRKLSDQQPVDAEPRRRRAVKKNPQSEADMDETLRKFVSESPEE
jgi:FtsZ-interacting cell division protein ZipA